MRMTNSQRVMFFLVPLGLAVASCKREERGLRVSPPSASAARTISLTDFHAGATGSAPATQQAGGSPIVPGHVSNEYEQNGYAMSEGKRLYNYFNCVGCHFHGGGGIGPPLMDDTWIYGSEPEQIHATILEGRPNGMPAFRGKVADYQVWQIIAYVRSMSGLADKGAAPGRDDHMSGKKPENSTEKMKPQQATEPQ